MSQRSSSWRNGEGVFDFDLADENVVAVYGLSPLPAALEIVEQAFQFGMFSVGDVPIVTEHELPQFGDSQWVDRPLVGKVGVSVYEEFFKLCYGHLSSVS